MANDMNVMLRTIPSIRKLLKKIDFVEADALIIDQPSFMSLWKYIKSEQVIYRPTDLYHNMKHNGDIITKIEEKIVAASQAVVATSHPVGAYIQSINRPMFLYISSQTVSISMPFHMILVLSCRKT